MKNSEKALFVFSKFNSLYGPKWGSSLPGGESMYKFMVVDWNEALTPYPENQIKWAVNQLHSVSREWPPNQFEFLNLCAGITPEAIHELANKSYFTYVGWEIGEEKALRHYESQAKINPVELFKYLQGTPDERSELDQAICYARGQQDPNVKNLPLVRKHTPPKLTVL